MRNYQKFTIVLLLGMIGVFLAINPLQADGIKDDWKFKIDSKSIGVIRNQDGKEIGSAFVVGKNRHVVTCAHLGINNNYTYRGIKIQKDISLKSLYYLPNYDLSVFTMQEPAEIYPLEFGDISRIRPGDFVVYIGWDSKLSQLKINKAIVFSMGSVMNQGEIIEFLEFEGVGLPGYSGGPVFDTNGNVIALMREAWMKQDIKGETASLINRAFSIKILSVLEDEVYLLKKQAPDNSDTNDLMRLISIHAIDGY